jgi:hypothetical protein
MISERSFWGCTYKEVYVKKAVCLTFWFAVAAILLSIGAVAEAMKPLKPLAKGIPDGFIP